MPSFLVTDIVLANPTDGMIGNCNEANIDYSVFDVNSDCIYFNCRYNLCPFFGEIYKSKTNYYIKFTSISNHKWLITDGYEISELVNDNLDPKLIKLHNSMIAMYSKISNSTVELFC